MSINVRGTGRIAAAVALLAISCAIASTPPASASAPGIAARTAPDPELGGALLASHDVVVHYPSPSAPRLPDVPDQAYVIANADTGQVLAAKDAHGLYPPASILKVLTAITMIPRLDPNATIVASKRAASVEPNIVGLVAGRRYPVADLFYALLMISANDAAVALAEAAGSFDQGVALMNAEARRLRAYDVVARQPNGLEARGQVVSAYDMALIARQALRLPDFVRYDSALTAPFHYKPGKSVWIANQNTLLTNYRGGLGGKIGWTDESGATYIGMARRHGVTLIVTELHCASLTEIASAEKLLDWGFAMNGRIRPVGQLVAPVPVTPAARHATAGQAGGTTRPASTTSGIASTPARRGLLALAAVVAVATAALTLRTRRRVSRARQAADQTAPTAPTDPDGG